MTRCLIDVTSSKTCANQSAADWQKMIWFYRSSTDVLSFKSFQRQSQCQDSAPNATLPALVYCVAVSSGTGQTQWLDQDLVNFLKSIPLTVGFMLLIVVSGTERSPHWYFLAVPSGDWIISHCSGVPKTATLSRHSPPSVVEADRAKNLRAFVLGDNVFHSHCLTLVHLILIQFLTGTAVRTSGTRVRNVSSFVTPAHSKWIPVLNLHLRTADSLSKLKRASSIVAVNRLLPSRRWFWNADRCNSGI